LVLLRPLPLLLLHLPRWKGKLKMQISTTLFGSSWLPGCPSARGQGGCLFSAGSYSGAQSDTYAPTTSHSILDRNVVFAKDIFPTSSK
jgi:hypothetical protein